MQQPSEWSAFLRPRMQVDGRPVRLLQQLGYAATVSVWLCLVETPPDPSNPSASRRQQQLVCRAFQLQAAFDKERATWEGLRAREAALTSSAAATDCRLRQLMERPRLTLEGAYRPEPAVPSFSGALFFLPCGEASAHRHRDDATFGCVQDLQDAFACLEWLRALRVVHRDLSPRHFLRHQGRLFLIDFGSATLLPEEPSQEPEEVSFSGSSYYAPNSVLQVLAESRSAHYRAAFAHDLESLVKLCLADHDAHVKTTLPLLDRRDYRGILTFWQGCERAMDGQRLVLRWAQALQHARDNRLPESRAALAPFFRSR